MTRRERLERKLEKRAEWAEGRDAKAARHFQAAHSSIEGIPMGQPILVGHHSERRHRAALDRCDRNMRNGVESENMADHHRSKAAGLEDQLDSSIFSDDDDAIEALEARIAEREAEAARIKAYNASCRKAAKSGGMGDTSLLDEAQRRDILSIARVCPYQVGKGGAFPAYKSSNLRANINRDKKRIEQVRAQQARAEKAEAAGGVVVERFDEYCRVTFAEKPDRSVLTALKEAGFHWGAGSWSGRTDKLPPCVTT